MYEGDYTVKLDDGTECIIHCSKGNKKIDNYGVLLKPKSSDNKEETGVMIELYSSPDSRI